MLRFLGLFCVLIGLVGCSSMPTHPSVVSEALPTSFAEADSLYNALGTTMDVCTDTKTYGQLSVLVTRKTANGKIAHAFFFYGGSEIFSDSISASDAYGIDIMVNKRFNVQNIAVVLGDKDYAGNAMLRRLIVNGEVISNIFPFGEAKLFGSDKIISYQLVSTGSMRGVTTKRYVVYDATNENIACQFDQQ